MNDPKIRLEENVLDDPERLFHELRDGIHWDESMAARKTASFGRPYNYSQMSYPETPLPSQLVPVVKTLNELLGIAFNNCLLNYYETGKNTMGFHSDDTSQLQPGTGVAIVSLGSARRITFRNKADRTHHVEVDLLPGSVLYMDDAVQGHWLHAIKKQPDAGPRISLTWRAFI